MKFCHIVFPVAFVPDALYGGLPIIISKVSIPNCSLIFNFNVSP